MTNPDVEIDLLDVRDVVRRTKRPESEVRRAIAAGELRHRRPGRRILIDEAAVKDWIRSWPEYGPGADDD